MRSFLEKIKSFGLYINGRPIREEGLSIQTNPFSGRVVGKVFLSPLESYLFDEMTPTEEITVKENSPNS